MNVNILLIIKFNAFLAYVRIAYIICILYWVRVGGQTVFA